VIPEGNVTSIAMPAAAPGLQTESHRESSVLETSSGTTWYAVYTCTRHEKRVRQLLQERQIDCFLPLYRSVRRWKDRRKELELALFPGYVFVYIHFGERLRVLQLPSVVNFVTFGNRPAAIAASEIESLRSGVANGLCLEPHPYLKIGRRVRIKQGPLAGSTGILLRKRKKDKLRVVLSIDLIMRSVAVEIDACDLEWIPQPR
jgi:transcription antitermination factor NusG